MPATQPRPARLETARHHAVRISRDPLPVRHRALTDATRRLVDAIDRGEGVQARRDELAEYLDVLD